MKILIVGVAHPYRGGIAAFNERLALQYQKEGHEVRIETFTLQYPSFLFPGKTQYTTAAAPSELHIVRTINSCNPFNWIKVGLRLRKEGADMAIVKFWLPFLGPCLGTISHLIRGNKKTTTVSVLDNIVPHEKRIGDRLFTNYFVKSMDGFVAMSQTVMDDLLTFDKKKPKLLSPHPLYDNFGEQVSRKEALRYLKLEEGYTYLLFFGLIRDYKGLDILLHAFADKRLRNTNTKLIIAGEFYNNSDTYHALAKELQIEGSIVWHSSYIPDEEVKYYFGAADLVVQPYKTATQSGITQIAYHFEKPMLVTDVGGLAEIVPHGKVGYTVAPNSGAVADSLVDFCSNHQENRFLSGIREEKEKYMWDKMSAATYRLLSEKTAKLTNRE